MNTLIICNRCGFIAKSTFLFVYMGDKVWQCKNCHLPNSSTLSFHDTPRKHSFITGMANALLSKQKE